MKKEVILTIIFLNIIFASAQNENVNTLSLDDEKPGFLSKEIIIPENLQIASRIVFGIPIGTSINLQTLIILSSLLIMFFGILAEVLGFTPFFEGNKRWIGSVIVTLLIATSGAFFESTKLILSFLSFSDKWGMVYLLFILVVLFILFFGASRLIHLLKNKVSKEDAYLAGFKLAGGKYMHRRHED